MAERVCAVACPYRCTYGKTNVYETSHRPPDRPAYEHREIDGSGVSRERYRCAPRETEDLEQWNGEGQTKIALAVNSLAQLESLKSRCEALGMLHALISDAGRTELAPGTITALAIGPADDAFIDRVTGFTPMLK